MAFLLAVVLRGVTPSGEVVYVRENEAAEDHNNIPDVGKRVGELHGAVA
jgi:hypothetical protein